MVSLIHNFRGISTVFSVAIGPFHTPSSSRIQRFQFPHIITSVWWLLMTVILCVRGRLVVSIFLNDPRCQSFEEKVCSSPSPIFTQFGGGRGLLLFCGLLFILVLRTMLHSVCFYFQFRNIFWQNRTYKRLSPFTHYLGM